jgi:hypothetical protein
MLASLGEALDDLVRARADEGRRLQAIVLDQLTAIAGLVGVIERSPARSPAAVKQRLKEQVGRLLEAGVTVVTHLKAGLRFSGGIVKLFAACGGRFWAPRLQYALIHALVVLFRVAR